MGVTSCVEGRRGIRDIKRMEGMKTTLGNSLKGCDGAQANFLAIKYGPRRQRPTGFLVLSWKPRKGGRCSAWPLRSPPACSAWGAQKQGAHCSHSGSWLAAGCFLHEVVRTRDRCWDISRLQELVPTLVPDTAHSCHPDTWRQGAPLWVQPAPPGESLQGLQRRGESCAVRSGLGAPLPPPTWAYLALASPGMVSSWGGDACSKGCRRRCRWRAYTRQGP